MENMERSPQNPLGTEAPTRQGVSGLEHVPPFSGALDGDQLQPLGNVLSTVARRPGSVPPDAESSVLILFILG